MKPLGLMIISKESWTDTRWARKQWLPFYMAKRQQVSKIIYVDRHRAWWRRNTATKNVKEGVISVRQEALVLPFERFPPVRSLNRKFIARRLKPLLDPSLKWIVIFYHPYDVDLIKCLSGGALTVFDWTEDWAVFHGNQKLDFLQREAVMSSDMVLTVTELLRQKALAWGKGSSNVHTLPNATAFTSCDKSAALKPNLIPEAVGPRIGFIGHAGPWFDVVLISRLAERHPEWQWIIAGGVEDQVREVLSQFSSIHWMGVLPPFQLMSLMCSCDVLVAPYVKEIRGDATKLYDYLVTGKPIISAPCETADRLRPYVMICENVEQWSCGIAKALVEDNVELRQKRKTESLRHHWDARVSCMLKLLGYG